MNPTHARDATGIFIALMLRFDRHLEAMRRGQEKLAKNIEFPAFYFNWSMVGYVLGLATTLYVMYTFKAAQVDPLPCCLP